MGCPAARCGSAAGRSPVRYRSVAFADAVQEVGGGPLDARVDMAGPVERGRPGEGAGGEDVRTAGCAVQGHLLVAARPRGVLVRRVSEQDPAGVLGQRGAREVTIGLTGD